MRLALMILLAAAAGLTAACQEALGPCQTTRDCLDQEVCFEGRCFFACDSDARCTDGQVCLQGACLELGSACDDDTTCLGVERCVAGRCRLSCSSSATCPDGSSCQGGVCLPPLDSGQPDDSGLSSDRPDGAQRDAAGTERSPPDVLMTDALMTDALMTDAAMTDSLTPDAVRTDTLRPDALRPDTLRPDVSLPDTAPRDAGGFDAAMLMACLDQYGDAPSFVLCQASELQCAFSALNSGTSCHNTCRLFGGLCLDALDNPTGAGLECQDTGTAIDCTTRHSTDICVCTRDLPPPSCEALYGSVREFLLCTETDSACTFHARTASASCAELCQGLGHACLDADNHQNGPGNECLPSAAAVDCDSANSTQLCTCERAAPRPSCETLYGAASEYVLCEEDWDSCQFHARTDGRTCDALCGDFGGICLGAIEDADAADGDGPCVPSTEPNTCATAHSDQICICSR